jgi:hypothetical protein
VSKDEKEKVALNGLLRLRSKRQMKKIEIEEKGNVPRKS